MRDKDIIIKRIHGIYPTIIALDCLTGNRFQGRTLCCVSHLITKNIYASGTEKLQEISIPCQYTMLYFNYPLSKNP